MILKLSSNLFLFLFIAVTVGIFMNPLDTYASETAQFRIESSRASYNIGSILNVRIYVDSHEPFNAFKLNIEYPNDELELVSYNTSSSVIDVWRSLPDVDRSSNIKLEGGSTAANSGSNLELITINFRVIKFKNIVKINISEPALFKADGRGTSINVNTTPLLLQLRGEETELFIESFDDFSGPVITNISVVKDPVFDEKLLSFSVYDIDSGVRKTFARSRKWVSWSNLAVVENPIRLESGQWAFQLISLDNDGNVSSKTIYLKNEIYMKLLVPGIIVALLALILLRWTERYKSKYTL